MRSGVHWLAHGLLVVSTGASAFAVVVVVIATLAVAGFWAVGSAVAAAHLGGTFVETNDELMQTFSVALIAGLVFWQYFQWRLHRAHATPPQRGGIDDTILDLVYDMVGGLLAAVFGTAHLTGVSDELAERLSA